MAKITQADLDKLTVKDLDEVITMAQATILVKKDRELEELKSEIHNLAQSKGYSVADVLPAMGGKKKVAGGSGLPPKYRDPDDATNTWSGRGRKPGWLNAKIDAGADINDFLIAR